VEGLHRVPNGTAHWQVGDSTQQNGSWKMVTTRDKRKLSQFKISMGIYAFEHKANSATRKKNNNWCILFSKKQYNDDNGYHRLLLQGLENYLDRHELSHSIPPFGMSCSPPFGMSRSIPFGSIIVFRLLLA
jgi:hypothetical protein